MSLSLRLMYNDSSGRWCREGEVREGTPAGDTAVRRMSNRRNGTFAPLWLKCVFQPGETAAVVGTEDAMASESPLDNKPRLQENRRGVEQA